MSVSRRLGALALGALALGALGALATQAQAQVRYYNNSPGRRPLVPVQPMVDPYRVNPNFLLTPELSLRQAAYNTAVAGNAVAQIPPWVYGYNPYPSPVISTGPVVTPSTYGSPYGGYGLGAGYGPGYGGGTLATDPYGTGGGYGLSTTPGAGFAGASAYGANPYWNGAAANPYAGYLYGEAAVIASTGDYYKSIQQAKLTREQARQAAIETRRRLIQEEAEYERMRPRADYIIERDMAADLRAARRGAQSADVWSGKALNDLVQAINAPGRRPEAGPNIPLEEDLLKNVNLTDNSFKGSVALLKAGKTLRWPRALDESKFDIPRERFTAAYGLAVDKLNNKEEVKGSTISDLRANLAAMDELLGKSAEELSPSQFIEARRYLNQLAQAVRALEDRRVVNYFNGNWNARGTDVKRLIGDMRKNGLSFAPATPGEESAYNALYQALRAFDAGLQGSASASRKP